VTHNDIWLGDSRELCKKFKPETIQCVLTDPPFGVNNQSNMATTEAGKKHARKIAGDESPEQALVLFEAVTRTMMPAMKPNSDWYVFTSYQVLKEWLTALDPLFDGFGYQRKALGIWNKQDPGMGDLESWGMGMEFILYYKRGNRAKSADRRNFVLNHPKLRPVTLIHPHEKPEGLLADLIKFSTSPGDWLVDPFGGSGSMVRAARNCNRNAIAIEYDKENYDAAKKKLDGQGAGMFDDDDAGVA
jgi:adenine-specific DNA-methyltransferase